MNDPSILIKKAIVYRINRLGMTELEHWLSPLHPQIDNFNLEQLNHFNIFLNQSTELLEISMYAHKNPRTAFERFCATKLTTS